MVNIQQNLCVEILRDTIGSYLGTVCVLVHLTSQMYLSLNVKHETEKFIQAASCVLLISNVSQNEKQTLTFRRSWQIRTKSYHLNT